MLVREVFDIWALYKITKCNLKQSKNNIAKRGHKKSNKNSLDFVTRDIQLTKLGQLSSIEIWLS